MGPRAIVATLAPGLVVFALPAFGLIARNPEFFEGDFAAGRDLYILSLLVVALGFGLWGLSRWKVGRFLWTCYLLITPAWFVYTVAGNWDRAGAAVAVMACVVAVAWYAQKSGPGLTRGIEVLSGMLLLAVLATTLLEARSTPGRGTDLAGGGAPVAAPLVDPVGGQPAATSTQPTPNIYHIVMDEYQTDMFEAALTDELREALAGFLYFPDARTSFGRTEMSMAATLGARNYDYRATPQDFVDAALRGPDSSLEKLRDAGYRTTGLFHLASLYGSPSPFDESMVLGDYVEGRPRGDSSGLINSLWLYSNTPTEMAERLLPKGDFNALAGENLLPDDAPPVSVWSLQKFIGEERRLQPEGRYTLIHLILPHFPYVLSDDCRYTEGRLTTPLDQAACANHLTAALLDELKRLNRFDDSVIVVQGDHGARFELDGAQLRQLRQDFSGEEWNNARSKSLLLIKPAGSTESEPLVVSEYPAQLTDIMPTIFDSVGIDSALGADTTSLLGTVLPVRETRFYHFYDKGEDGLPDGELTRFVVESDGLRYDRTIALPSG